MDIRRGSQDGRSNDRGRDGPGIFSLPVIISAISVYMVLLITYYAPELKDWGIPAPLFIGVVAIATVMIPAVIKMLFDDGPRKR